MRLRPIELRFASSFKRNDRHGLHKQEEEKEEEGKISN